MGTHMITTTEIRGKTKQKRHQHTDDLHRLLVNMKKHRLPTRRTRRNASTRFKEAKENGRNGPLKWHCRRCTPNTAAVSLHTGEEGVSATGSTLI